MSLVSQFSSRDSGSRIHPFAPWPEEEAGKVLHFRLIYRGSLPAQRGGKGGSRVFDKHRIRKHLHPQLKKLWEESYQLAWQLQGTRGPFTLEDHAFTIRPWGKQADKTADRYKEGKFRFLPLVTDVDSLACKLDILFLRRDAPGNLIENGGDLDNRIKTLLDALKVPDRGSIDNVDFEDGLDPFYCLLSDDRLITEISVSTDRLLMPIESDERIHDVLLVIGVTVKVTEPSLLNFDFLGE